MVCSLQGKSNLKINLRCSSHVDISNTIPILLNAFLLLHEYFLSQISSILANGCNCNGDKVEDELAESLAKIDLNDMGKVRVASYENLYGVKLTSNESRTWAEDKTLRVMKKVQSWPRARSGRWVPRLISLMSIIIALSVVNILGSGIIETAQLHYTLMLQRYLR